MITVTIGLHPYPIDIEVYKGDDFEVLIQVVDTAGVAVDLSGSVVEAQVRLTPASASTVGEFDVTVIGSVIHLVLAAADSADFRSGFYDIQVTDELGGISTLIAGKVIASSDVTR